MKIKALIIIVVSFSFLAFMNQPNYRKGIFLSHSTGQTIWGPNGSSTSVPDEIAKYNLQHNFSSDNSFNIIREDWPLIPWDNEWSRWHNIFNGQDTNAYIEPFFKSYEFIIIKSCFPSSDLADRGSSSDTLDPTRKSIYNYKWHWRSIIRKMESNPGNFFIIWTNAPLVAGQTNDNSALLSDSFCRWAKDTLAEGLDAGYGKFPGNVYVFDFFHKLAGTDGKLQLKYAVSNGDSHPNSAGTELVAPQLVNEILDAATEYELKFSGIMDDNNIIVTNFSLKQNYPNPFNPNTIISYSLPAASKVKLVVYNTLGVTVKVIETGFKNAGNYSVNLNASDLKSGIYFYQLETGKYKQIKKMVLIK
jgi:hypothetical protein